MSVERQIRKRPAELDGPELPFEAAHIWSWWISLHRARGSNGMGPNPIGYPDLAAWASLTGTAIRPSEIEAVFEIDQAWLANQAKSRDK